jgi:nucleoside-diphosphate-sugar epimerase
LNYAWELLQKTEGISLPAIYEAPRQGDVRDSQADVTRAVAELGHSPQFSFEEGLRLTLDWYRSQGANNSVA